MPVIKSALKKLRQTRTKTARNQAKKSFLRELITKFRRHPEPELYRRVVSALDKTAKTRVIHKNKASRLKSRLAKLVPKSTSQSAPLKPKPKKAAKK
jgi:small subunit ribosomal protein S20